MDFIVLECMNWIRYETLHCGAENWQQNLEAYFKNNWDGISFYLKRGMVVRTHQISSSSNGWALFHFMADIYTSLFCISSSTWPARKHLLISHRMPRYQTRAFRVEIRGRHAWIWPTGAEWPTFPCKRKFLTILLGSLCANSSCRWMPFVVFWTNYGYVAKPRRPDAT